LWAAAWWGNNKCRRRRAWKISRTWLTIIIMLIVHPAGAAADPTLSNIAHMAVPEVAAAATVTLMAVAPCLQGALAAVWSTAAAVFALRRRRAWGKRVHILQEAAARGQASIRWSAPAHPYVPAPLAMLTPTCKRNKSQEAVRAKARTARGAHSHATVARGRACAVRSNMQSHKQRAHSPQGLAPAAQRILPRSVARPSHPTRSQHVSRPPSMPTVPCQHDPRRPLAGRCGALTHNR
jgi:hypothetical protein